MNESAIAQLLSSQNTDDSDYVTVPGILRLWDLNSGNCLHTWTGDSAIFCCAVSSDGFTFVAGEVSGRLHFLRWERLN
ncbi:hypothetical protein [Anabaena subtropica]|uniref:Uncharacterized protein n=1 Tax=Anabaena subtropica FACHB-260 TaxID=2692884 RepID=A0ABR8CTF9_9NOST|nr:hypothetical protein [Anabaena subtropica]MBD2345663.1 hypothetical protein [Anabaena subtropica FACHB-260]